MSLVVTTAKIDGVRSSSVVLGGEDVLLNGVMSWRLGFYTRHLVDSRRKTR